MTAASTAVVKKPDEPIIVRDDVALFDTGKFEHMWRIANTMAAMSLMPDHLKGHPADCVMVVEQARTWQMSPTAVGSKTFVVGGKLAYEGQLVAAVVNTRAGIDGRLKYRYEGTFDRAKQDASTRKIFVSGKFKGDAEAVEIAVEWKDGFAMSKGARDKWLSQPDQQLAYFGARVWARRHCPEVLLGVYTPEELEAERDHQGADNARDVTPPRPTRAQIAAVARTETPDDEAAAAHRELDRQVRATVDGTVATDEPEVDAETGEVTEPRSGGNVQQPTSPGLGWQPQVLPMLRQDGNWTAWQNDALELIEKLPTEAFGEVREEMDKTGIPASVHGALSRAMQARSKPA